MRCLAGAFGALLSIAAPAQAPPDPAAARAVDAAATTALNAAIRTRLERTDAQNARVRRLEADYARDRATYEAAMRQNAQAVAAAGAARAAHEAEMAVYAARWSRPAAAAPQPRRTVAANGATEAPAPTRRVCRWRTLTGSLAQRVRECSTVREDGEARDAAQQSLRTFTSGSSGCGAAICNR